MDVKLVMFKANAQRKDFPVVNKVTVIGRAEACDLRVPLLSVSRRHCELVVSDDGLRVRDLASSNGTYVNNQRINEADLKAGDRLVIGPIVFTVQVNGVPEEIQAVKTRGQVLAEKSHAGTSDEVGLPAGLEDDSDDSGMDETALGAAEDEQSDEQSDPISALEGLNLGDDDENQEDQQ
jgi:pSer/pThr/pTyr-binding forkhead associated (FHA) protein